MLLSKRQNNLFKYFERADKGESIDKDGNKVRA